MLRHLTFHHIPFSRVDIYYTFTTARGVFGGCRALKSVLVGISKQNEYTEKETETKRFCSISVSFLWWRQQNSNL